MGAGWRADELLHWPNGVHQFRRRAAQQQEFRGPRTIRKHPQEREEGRHALHLVDDDRASQVLQGCC